MTIRLLLVWLLLALLLPGVAAHAQSQAAAPPGPAAHGPPVTHPIHPIMTPLGPVTYPFNDHWTTKYGPAYADIMVTGSNMLACKPPAEPSVAYALCYYSGPAAPTGISSGNPALPCTLSADHKSADCVCYKLSAAAYPHQRYYVDINSILNLNVYRSTVKTCGHDGSGCSRSSTVPPACTAVDNATMMPPAKIVSVFSQALNKSYSTTKKPGSTSCAPGLYAACMTAPCVDSGKTDGNGHPLVDCHCPVFHGRYEVGENQMPCNANHVPNPSGGTAGGATYVWSAAHNPTLNPYPAKPTKTP